MELKKIFNTFYLLLIFLLLLFGGLTFYTYGQKNAGFNFFVVQSGSMEPTIKTGSIIVISNLNKSVVSPVDLPLYQPGEIITFLAAKETLTHRVVAREVINGDYFYQTKGDANQGADVKKVNQKDVLGKVIFSLPYLGYAVTFSRTQMGYIFLIVVPATIIIYSEIINIKKEIKKYLAGKKSQSI